MNEFISSNDSAAKPVDYIYRPYANDQPFRPVLRFTTKRAAKECESMLEVLHRKGEGVKFFGFVQGSRGMKVQFYAGSESIAKLIRAKYFSESELSWDTTLKDVESHQ